LVGTYIDLFARAAAHNRKPHYLLHSRPGVMDRGWRRNCASAASRSSAGCARDCRQSIVWRASPAEQTHSGDGLPRPKSRANQAFSNLLRVRARFRQPCQMTHFYRNVPKLGNVAVSRHAQKRMAEDEIPQEAFERVLLTPVKQDIRDGADILWRERHTDCDTGESHPLDWCQVAPSFADPVARGLLPARHRPPGDLNPPFFPAGREEFASDSRKSPLYRRIIAR